MTDSEPLTGLDEFTMGDGSVTWNAESRGGAQYVIIWSPRSGNVSGSTFPGARTRYRARASDIGAARAEARRIAALIAAGKRG